MKPPARILIVDDEAIMRDSLNDWLMEDGYEAVAVEDGQKAIEIVRSQPFNVVLCDLKMPGMDGIETMRKIKEINKDLPVIIITAYATVNTAVESMKQGAYDYIVKPFDPEEVSHVIRKIISHQQLLQENILLRQELKKVYQFRDIVGKNYKMQEIFELIRTVADSDASVLILGESGTGKELIARAIHYSSRRAEKPFVSVSCSALPETLLESELFGYEKGAFTGAVRDKPGRFEEANGGTLFLDEIGEMKPETQLHLLRVLQEREIRRLGGTGVIKVDVRIISATNKDLERAVKEGSFREDLYYRFNVVTIQIPPLREREDDIPLLAERFLMKYNVKNNKNLEGISPKAIALLMQYDWPGNVRELENAIERAVVITKHNIIQPEDLPANIQSFQESKGIKPRKLKEVEKEHIQHTLEENKWNISKTSKVLGIDRSTLYKKIRQYGLSPS
ncbi:Fis family transcriptional regulator [bacterium (candidate division B38) B3_B38]|nr:MAG: Fis family transcriptional regulator [bacterium (candidate division B38) B3_B38]